ncbi:MAG: hypothetical protein J6Y98_00500 [Bacteroidales bacterium]|nr:hypothetical protein [Bacteroidales bacterium]
MKNFFILLLIVFSIVALCFAGLGIKIIVRKKGEFKRHCSSMDPYTGESSGCLCANKIESACNNRKQHPYQPLEVNNELMKEMSNN